MAKTETATLAGGCFWCTEAIFQRIKGVTNVVSGYAGGQVVSPTYDAVCTGKTGHAEAVQIVYDPEIVSYKKLLEIFFKTHNPTTTDRQGNDVGPQYRSAIFYQNDKQKETSRSVIKKLQEESYFKDPIVTEITEFTNFYPAEDTHQDYYNRNKNQPYCRVIIDPKVRNLLQHYPDSLS